MGFSKTMPSGKAFRNLVDDSINSAGGMCMATIYFGFMTFVIYCVDISEISK